MSEFENVVGGKLRLKGKPLDVKASGVSKKKKHKKRYELFFNRDEPSDVMKEMHAVANGDNDYETASGYAERLTPAERRYLEQWKQLEAKRLIKSASESHRDRIQNLNNYLANLSEHYDIPKVGPG